MGLGTGCGCGIVFSPHCSCLPSPSVVVINRPAIHPPSRLGAGGLSFDAVVGGGGALVLIIAVLVCVGGGWVRQHDMACIRGHLGAHLVGIPLLGCPGVTLRAPDPN